MSKSLFQRSKVTAAPVAPPANADKANQVFLDYLEDKLPPLLATEALTTVLRNTPPVYYGLPQVVDMVRTWAGRRAKDSGRPVAFFLASALWQIGHADAAEVIEGFSPGNFFPEFINRLRALCPVEQQPDFETRLSEVRDYFAWSFNNEPSPVSHEMRQPEGIAIVGTIEDEFNQLADQLLETYNQTNEGPFNRVISQLRENLYRPGFQPVFCLERLIEHGVALFNRGKHVHAEQVFNLVREGLQLPQLGAAGLGQVRASHHSDEFDREKLLTLLNDGTKHQSLKVTLQVFADLEARNLLKRLRFEKDKEDRRLVLTLIKLHGPDVFPLIIEELQVGQKETRSWFYLRNLIFLLGKVAAPSDLHRYLAVNMTGQFLFSKYQQLRAAALSTLSVLGGESVVDFLLSALNQEHYSPVDIGSDQLVKHFSNILAFLARYPNDQSMTALAGVVTGAKLNFLPKTDALRESAYTLLKHHASRLPTMTARFLTNHLESELRSRGVGFGGFAVGIDTEYCLKLLDLLAHSRLGETQKLMQELKTRYARHALGRRAADILAAQSQRA